MARGCRPRSTGSDPWCRCGRSTPGRSPKYCHFECGITWLNAVNDQVAGIEQVSRAEFALLGQVGQGPLGGGRLALCPRAASTEAFAAALLEWSLLA